MEPWRDVFGRLGSIVCLSTADWHSPLWTNKQHLMSRLAEVVPVVFVESLGMRRPRLAAADLERMGGRVRRALGRAPARPAEAAGDVTVVAPLVVPWHGRRAVRALNRRLLARQLDGPLGASARPRVLWTYTPLAVELVDLAAFDAVVYHAVDDLATVPRVASEVVIELERRLAPRADVIFATSQAVADRLAGFGGRTVVVGNVADDAHFAAARRPGPLPPDLEGIDGPRVTFTGALSTHKVDWELLDAVAAALPDHRFVLVGPAGTEGPLADVPALRRPNVHAVGHRPYDELPAYLRGSVAGIVPYRRSPHTDAVFPMKVFEYLAAGLPVVTTDLPALRAVPDLPVACARTAEEFATAIAGADRSPEAARRRAAFAAGHTWDRLLSEMAGHLELAPRAPGQRDSLRP